MQRKNAPETQFSLVNDTTADQKTFGEPNANLKTFGKSNATVKLRLAAAKCAFPRLLLVCCCLLVYGKNQRPAPPVINKHHQERGDAHANSISFDAEVHLAIFWTKRAYSTSSWRDHSYKCSLNYSTLS